MTCWRFLHALGGYAVVPIVLTMAGGCETSTDRPPMGGDQVAVTENDDPAFAVGLVPTVAPPIPMGTLLEFRLSSTASGYGHLYMISVSGDVTRLAENLPLAAGAQTDYPRPDDGLQIRASPPAGIERLILLVTLQPFVGLANSQGQLATRPVGLPLTAEGFLRAFNEATDALPPSSWAVAEERVQVVE